MGSSGDHSASTTQELLTPPQEDAELEPSFSWLDQRRDSFFLTLVGAGGEVESLVRNAHACGGRSYGLPTMLRSYVDAVVRDDSWSEEETVSQKQAVAAAALTLVLCLSSHAGSLTAPLLELLSVEQAKEANVLAGE